MTGAPILLIDDHAMFRSGICMVLEAGIPGARVQEAASIEQAVRAVDAPPAVVLLDVGLQGVNGVEGLAVLRQRWPSTPVVMLSSDANSDTVSLALARGAVAFVSKAETAGEIVRVVGQALGGELTASSTRTDAAPSLLTPRQCEVLDLLAQGLSNKVIARQLHLSEFTVRGHVQAVLGVLGVTSRAQATFEARRRGLLGR
jgi:DNA-binding NarL/FixJ family response regulator